MPERPTDYTMPNVGSWDGEVRIKWVILDGGVIFARRGGKALDKHGGYYRLATANSSNLAGFAVTEQYPSPFATGGQHPVSDLYQTSTGDRCPVDFGDDRSYVFPCSNRRLVEGDLGHDFDIVVNGAVIGNPVQCVNLSASVYGILRAVARADNEGDWGAFKIPDEHKYGDQ